MCWVIMMSKLCLFSFSLAYHSRRAFHTKRPHTGSEEQRALDVPSYVLHATMKGQNWMDGDEDYHLDIAVSVLLIYGMQDQFVSLEEEEWMQEVSCFVRP